MNIRIVAAFALALSSGQALALPIDDVVKAIRKIFKGSSADHASTAEQAAKQLPAHQNLEVMPNQIGSQAKQYDQMLSPSPNLAAEVFARNARDADAYKVLRAAAGKGDPAAMLKMSDMTATGKVTDFGEPWYLYWLFRAVAIGSREAKKRSHEACDTSPNRRAADRWFDAACTEIDGKRLYVGDQFPAAYPRYQPDFLTKPNGQTSSK
jgi:TPR repeat protein